jgi:SAM-dependent methyltransferase
MDWSVGSYEDTGKDLEPAARVLVDRAAPQPGERAVDAGCGTGNATVLLAERGARATGVDPAERLLEVARERAASAGLEIAFVAGSAESMPLPDRSADVIVSCFGIIFAPDASAAARELARVRAPGGRILITAWIPEGTISRLVRLGRELMPQPPSGPPPFAWHDGEAVAQLFEPYGLSAALDDHTIAFTAASPEAYLDGQLETHPMWVGVRPQIERAGMFDEMRARGLALLKEGNEDPDAFRVTSRYVVVALTGP